MPIRHLQTQLAQTGRIRLGVFDQAKNRAKSIDTFRFTSQFQAQIDAIAARYGGEPRPWKHPKRGQQFEVITTSNEIPVYVPRQDLDPNYELWGREFCQRRCDGVWDTVQREDCVCDPADRKCSMTLRLAVILPEVPGDGQWRLDTGGENAIRRLMGKAPWISNAPMPLPAMLRIYMEERRYLDAEDEMKPKVNKFPVPSLDFDWLVPEQVFGGQVEAALRQQLETINRAALPPAEAQHAIEAAIRPTAEQTPPANPDQEWLDRIRTATDKAQLTTLWRGAVQKYRGGQNIPPPVKTAFEIAGRAFTLPDEPKTVPTVAPASTAAIPAVTAPDISKYPQEGDEPDADMLTLEILSLSGKLGWDTPILEAKLLEFCGKTPDEANGWELESFRDELKKPATR